MLTAPDPLPNSGDNHRLSSSTFFVCVLLKAHFKSTHSDMILSSSPPLIASSRAPPPPPPRPQISYPFFEPVQVLKFKPTNQPQSDVDTYLHKGAPPPPSTSHPMARLGALMVLRGSNIDTATMAGGGKVILFCVHFVCILKHFPRSLEEVGEAENPPSFCGKKTPPLSLSFCLSAPLFPHSEGSTFKSRLKPKAMDTPPEGARMGLI